MEPAYSDEEAADLQSSIPNNLDSKLQIVPVDEYQLNKFKDLLLLYKENLAEIEVTST